MPQPRLPRPSALALSFVLPWLPQLPVVPPTEPLPAEASAEVLEEPLVLPGVVIEEIPKGSALEEAGLQVGDVILSWERLPNPPSNPEGASGVIESPFDWMWVKIEQAPRGELRLAIQGRRGLQSVQGWLESLRLQVTSCGVANDQCLLGQRSLSHRHPVPTLKSAQAGQNPLLTLRASQAAVECWNGLGTTMPRETFRPQSSAMARCQGELDKALSEFNFQLAALIWAKLDRTGLESTPSQETALRRLLTADAMSQLTQDLLQAELASRLLRKGDLLASRAEFEAVRQRRLTLAPESLLYAAALEYLGVIEHSLGNFSAAKEYHEEALAYRENKAPGSDLHAKSLGNLGLVAIETGAYLEAERYLELALSIQRAAGAGPRDIASTLHNLGAIALFRWDLDRAENLLNQALQIEAVIQTGGAYHAQGLDGLGQIYYLRGDFSKAEQLFLEALRHYQAVPGERWQSETVRGHLANIYFRRGDLGLALEWYQSALDLSALRRDGGRRSAAYLQNLGLVALQLGDLELAHTYLTRALASTRASAPGTLREAEVLKVIGIVLELGGSDQSAVATYREALGILARTEGGWLEEAAVRGRLAVVKSRLGDLLGAERLNEEILASLSGGARGRLRA